MKIALQTFEHIEAGRAENVALNYASALSEMGCLLAL